MVDKLILSDKMQSLRILFKQRKVEQYVNPVKNPRYDEIYKQGVNWLDSIK